MGFSLEEFHHCIKVSPHNKGHHKATSHDQISPGVLYMMKLLGSNVPRKDLIIGFDIYKQLNYSSWLKK